MQMESYITELDAEVDGSSIFTLAQIGTLSNHSLGTRLASTLVSFPDFLLGVRLLV